MCRHEPRFRVFTGAEDNVPVTGHFVSTTVDDLAVWRPSNGNWYILPGNGGGPHMVAWGLPGDVPMPGDYDGDGITDLAVWRASDENLYVSLEQQFGNAI